MFQKILVKILDSIAKGCYNSTENMSDLNLIVDLLGNLTIPEALQLVRILEEKWGIKATTVPQPITKVVPILEPDDEIPLTNSFDVVLVGVGPNKIQVIRELRVMNPTLGLREAKEYSESLPKTIIHDVSDMEATEVASRFRAVGAHVEIRPYLS